MDSTIDPFETTYHKDYDWPGDSPMIIRPEKPPEVTKPRGLLEVRPAPGSCTCDRHDWSPHFERAKFLKEREDCLVDKLNDVNYERMLLENAILHHPCGDINDKMKTIYQIDYSRKGYPVLEFKELKVDKDDPVAVPVPMLKIGLNNGYRDPTFFRYHAIKRPRIHPPQPITFKAEPFYLDDQFIGRSEYMDTISKMGLCTMKAMQQYKEPLPSSRRRIGDMCI